MIVEGNRLRYTKENQRTIHRVGVVHSGLIHFVPHGTSSTVN